MNEASEKNLKFEDSLLYQNNLDVLAAPFGVHIGTHDEPV